MTSQAISDTDMGDATDCDSIEELLKQIKFVRTYSKGVYDVELDAKEGILQQRKAELGCQ